MGFTDELDRAQQAADDIANLTRNVAALRKENGELRARLHLTESTLGTRLAPPKWAAPTKKRSGHVTVGLLLSDLHYEEVVRPQEINGHNAYDLSIAERRIRRAFEHGLEVALRAAQPFKVDGGVICLNGDLLTGTIHAELVKTNAIPVLPAALDLSALLVAGIELWATKLPNVDVYVEWGNHGRQNMKPEAKRAASENYDWLIGQLVARHFASHPTVKVHTTESYSLTFGVYNTRFLLTHGNHGIGRAAGGGIGGIWPPIMRMLAKMSQQHVAMGDPWDVALLGHWHQFVTKGIGSSAGQLIINGCAIGPTEWSMQSGFTPEPPSQTVFVVSPERGVTQVLPVFVGDKKREGW